MLIASIFLRASLLIPTNPQPYCCPRYKLQRHRQQRFFYCLRAKQFSLIEVVTFLWTGFDLKLNCLLSRLKCKYFQKHFVSHLLANFILIKCFTHICSCFQTSNISMYLFLKIFNQNFPFATFNSTTSTSLYRTLRYMLFEKFPLIVQWSLFLAASLIQWSKTPTLKKILFMVVCFLFNWKAEFLFYINNKTYSNWNKNFFLQISFVILNFISCTS